MRDLLADFRSDRCTGCLDSNVRVSAFLRYHSQAFQSDFRLQERHIKTLRYILVGTATYYRLTFSYLRDLSV